MKRILSVFLMLALILAGLAGCQGGAGKSPSEPAAQPVNMEATDEFIIYRPPYTPDWLSRAIMLFRQMYPEVKVTIEDFSTVGHGEKTEVGLTAEYNVRVTNELLAGMGPDIIFPEYLDINVKKAMSNHIFLDMFPYMEQDKNFREEDYLNNIFDAGSYEGARYIIPLLISFPVFISYTPKLEEIGIQKIEEGNTSSFLRQVSQTASTLQENPGFQEMLYPSGESCFCDLFRCASIELIDYGEKKVCMDEEGLRNFFESYKLYYPYDICGKDEIRRWFSEQPITDSHFFEAAPASMHFASTVSVLQTNGGYTLSTLQDLQGKVRVGYNMSVAVPSSSKNPYNAYRFIQLLLSPEMQKQMYSYDSSSIYRRALLAGGEYNNEHISENVFASRGIILTKPTDKQLEEYAALYDGIGGGYIMDKTAFQMAWEAMEPFFKDEKPYEACFDELKSKLTIYMDE